MNRTSYLDKATYTLQIMGLKTMTLVTTILLAGLVSLATIGFSNIAFAGTQMYKAQLSGDQEVPPVQTNASGNATLQIPLSAISSPQATVKYTVNVTDIENVTGAHIHMGKMGENGDIVVTLCKAETCSAGGMTGALSLRGTFNATNLEGPMAGKQIDALATSMTNGETYVNVHSQQYPNGEIRGQITGGIQ
jgi:hypothetical protein